MKTAEREKIELLLPWYVTGKLTSDEKLHVETVLAKDAGLRKQVKLIREELTEAVLANEMLAAPASLNAENLMAKLRSEAGNVRQNKTGWLELLRTAFAGPERAPLRLAALAMMFLLVVQGATLVALLVEHEPGKYQTAGGQSGIGTPGTFAVVRLSDEARVSDLGKVLQERSFVIVDGPKAGGLFTVRIGAEGMSVAERDAKIAELTSLVGLVTFAAPLQ